jgi:uncharacterized protein DUF4255
VIHHAMSYITTELNNYLNLRSPADPFDRVVMSSLYDLDGSVNTGAREKVVFLLTNIEEDRVYQSNEIYKKRDDGVSEQVSPEARVNLYMLFIANMAIYKESVKTISNVISFFQAKNSFSYSNIPELAGIEGRFVLDLFTLTFEQQNHLWGTLGAKYVPSVMYKASMLTIQDARVEAEIPPIEKVYINE